MLNFLDRTLTFGRKNSKSQVAHGRELQSAKGTHFRFWRLFELQRQEKISKNCAINQNKNKISINRFLMDNPPGTSQCQIVEVSSTSEVVENVNGSTSITTSSMVTTEIVSSSSEQPPAQDKPGVSVI